MSEPAWFCAKCGGRLVEGSTPHAELEVVYYLECENCEDIPSIAYLVDARPGGERVMA